MTEIVELDNTSRVCFDSCERKYYFKHHLGIVLAEPQSMAAYYGISIHKGIESFYKGKSRDESLKAFGEEYAKWYDGKDEDRTVSNAIVILDEYFKRFNEDYLETKELEIGGVIIVKGEGIEVSYKSRIDRIALWKSEGKLVIEDWKTSKYVGSSFTVLRPNHQFIGYALTVREIKGENLDFFLTLIGSKVKKRFKEGEERVEIVRDYTRYSEEDFSEFKRGIINTALRLRECKETEYWPKRTHSCSSFQGCEYLSLCRTRKENEAEMIKQMYRKEVWRAYEQEG